MNITKLVIVPEGSEVARVYEWKTDPLKVEELLSFIVSVGKMPEYQTWTEDAS